MLRKEPTLREKIECSILAVVVPICILFWPGGQPAQKPRRIIPTPTIGLPLEVPESLPAECMYPVLGAIVARSQDDVLRTDFLSRLSEHDAAVRAAGYEGSPFMGEGKVVNDHLAQHDEAREAVAE